jgi:hypothetical protein
MVLEKKEEGLLLHACLVGQRRQWERETVMTKRLILALLLSCSPLWATTYYVDNCVSVGNDRNNGTSTSTPWLTINKVNTSTFNPGDSILFESTCTWREELGVPSSGSAGSPITFGAYGTGAAPIISGANLFTSWTPSSGSVYYTSYSTAPNQVFEDGGRLTQNTVSTASLAAGQWYLDTVNSRIWVYLTAGDNPSGHILEASQRPVAIDVYGVAYIAISNLQTQEAQGNGVNICCGSSQVDVSGVLSENNFNEGIEVYESPNSSVVSSTAMYNGGQGIEFQNSPNALIDRCVAHHNAQLTGEDWTAGIHVSGLLSTNVTIQNSVSYSNGVGQPDWRGAGIWPDTVGAGLIVRYNSVFGNNFGGINIDADNGAAVYGNLAYNNGVAGAVAGFGIWFIADGNDTMTGHVAFGNTIWGNYSRGLVFQGYASGYADSCMSNTAENNIAAGTVNGPNFVAQYGCENPGTIGSGNVYTYNDFGVAASNFIEWGAGVYESTYSAWETAAGNCGTPGCSHSVESAPTFANTSAAQFWLTGGSPGIDAGSNLGSPYNIGLMPGSTWPTGVTTGPTNTPPDIGAFVYVPAVAPPSSLALSVH